MKIAIEGCAHGELEKIYASIRNLEKEHCIKVDLLICCGDFQATRNAEDLRCMAVPPKYQKMCSFYKYYSGEKVAPVLTIFIGGNHEASNYLQELAYGGWVAPRIYYMGYANVLNVAGVRIGGLSGIYKGHDYLRGHFEKPPYTEDTKRSAYHVRNLETFRLKQVKQHVDIFLSHDWPRGIYNYGNVDQLLRFKPFFTDEVKSNTLGSKPCEELLHHMKPTYWFAAHLHVKFAALVPHPSDNEDRVKTTKFLALDKCLPRRRFLQIVEVEHDEKKSIELEYDLEWLTIVHLTNHLLSVKRTHEYMPGPGMDSRWDFTPTKEEMEFIRLKFNEDLTIPQNFSQTAVPFDPKFNLSGSSDHHSFSGKIQARINPQTMAFCDRLSVDDPMALLMNPSRDSSFNSSQSQLSTCSPLPADLTRVSLDDSSCLDDSMELLLMSKSDNSFSMKRSMSSPIPRRLSLALPSPQNSDVDEPMKNVGDVNSFPDASSFPPLRLSLSLPSPRESDVDEPMCSEPVISHFSSSDIASTGEPATGSDSSSYMQPKVKKFKRRNESLYTRTEDG